jgi:DNA-binding NtrC family response regulator
MGEVLVAVKNNKLFQTLADACRDRGFAAVRALTLEEAESRLPEGSFSALIVNLDDIQTSSEKKIAARIRQLPAGLKILGLAAGTSLKTATGYIRSGLTDYLPVPPDPLELAQSLTSLLGSFADGSGSSAQTPNPASGGPHAGASAPFRVSGTGPSPSPPATGDRGSAQASGPRDSPAPCRTSADDGPDPAVVFPSRAIVGRSPALMQLFRIIAKVAATDSTVMVHGETGTGKELIARAIHLSSPRRDMPMVPVNCGAIPEELLETELFGHEKGAFTNAVKERAGRFELAQGGTVFLDEIGDMSPKLQVKLLRVLQEHEFEKVGGERTIRADIRVITATHVDLARAVREGRFREDLYYRLNVIPVSVPPLRERAADIPLLIDFFLKRLRETRASSVTGVSPSAMDQLCSYRWPGNIRELENLMERMVILADGDVLTDEDLPAWIRTVPDPADEARDELLKGFLEPDEGQYGYRAAPGELASRSGQPGTPDVREPAPGGAVAPRPDGCAPAGMDVPYHGLPGVSGLPGGPGTANGTEVQEKTDWAGPHDPVLEDVPEDPDDPDDHLFMGSGSAGSASSAARGPGTPDPGPEVPDPDGLQAQSSVFGGFPGPSEVSAPSGASVPPEGSPPSGASVPPEGSGPSEASGFSGSDGPSATPGTGPGTGPAETGLFSGTDTATDPGGTIPPEAPDPDAPPAGASGRQGIPDEIMGLVAPLLNFPAEGVTLNALMKGYEARLIEGALTASGGLKNTAARLLGINRTTLQEKLRKK